MDVVFLPSVCWDICSRGLTLIRIRQAEKMSKSDKRTLDSRLFLKTFTMKWSCS